MNCDKLPGACLIPCHLMYKLICIRLISFLFILAGFLTMSVDEKNSFLVTGDANGIIKVWDISEYCHRSMADSDIPPCKYR